MDYDIFLDLNFLNTTYLSFLKNLSFWTFTGLMICIGLLLIAYHFNEDGCMRSNIYSLAIIIGCATGLAFCVVFFAFVLLPACYLCAVFKDILITKYIIYPTLLTPVKEFAINCISIVLGVGIYSFIIGKGIKAFLDS